ncbi:MAG: hypothetical protein QNJ51_05625 [Calothrix sp. MO_167.B12]|nr:hypothetical protein [Calothrix sp. MO_167.B12]
MSTLCTAIGVLGTFYGIQEGLQGITLDTRSSAELMASSKELLMGMRTAFSTSLMGLGSGSFFTVFLFVTDLVRQKRRDNLRDKLDDIASPETIDNDNRELAQAINKVANQLTNLNSPSAKDIGNAVGENIRAILQEQQRLREIQENQGQQILQQLIQDLRVEVIEPVTQRLDESAILTREASQAVQILHQELGGISQSLASSIETIQNFQTTTLVRLQEFSGDLQQTLRDFQTDTRGVLEQTGEAINNAVSQSIEGMKAQRTAFKASAENAANTFLGIKEKLQQALQERAEIEQQILQSTRAGIIQILTQANTAFQQQTGTLQTVGQEASQLMHTSRKELMEGMQQMNGMLQNTNHTMQQQLEKFRDNYTAQLQDFFNQSINGMEKQRTAFVDSAENAANTFRGIRKELQKALQERAEIEQQTLQSTRTGIIHILSQANAAFKEQTGTLQTVGQEASGLMNDARENLLVTLGNIDQTLQHTRETVQEDLTQFREEYQSNLQNFFDKQNDLLEESLGEQRNGLSEVVTRLDNVFQEEYQRRSQLSEQVNNSMTTISKTARDVNKLAIATGLNSTERWQQMQELSRGIGEQTLAVKQEYGQLTSTFQESLEAWINHFDDSQKHFFKEADNSMSQVCSKLLHTAEVLVEINQNGNGRQNNG